MEIKGTVEHVGSTQNVTASFKKRDLVIKYAENPQYPELIKFEAHQDKCDKLDELRFGDEVTVHFNLRGREWVNKSGEKQYFNTLALWKFNIDRTSSAQTQYAPPARLPDPEDLPFN